jgi:hypothetical protein
MYHKLKEMYQILQRYPTLSDLVNLTLEWKLLGLHN